MSNSGKPIEILLVEDNPEDRELTLRALRTVNLANRVHTVEDGAQALDYLLGDGARRPKVVLLDLKLPKLGGLEVLARLRSDERTRTLPVVILTSSAEERDIVEGYRLGANSYIVKPVGFDDFLRSVKELGLYWLLLNKAPG